MILKILQEINMERTARKGVGKKETEFNEKPASLLVTQTYCNYNAT